MTVMNNTARWADDYNNVPSRFYDEAMTKRLLGRFIDHTSFRALEQAMTEGDTQAAFNAHIPSGAFVRDLVVYSAVRHADSITEALRGAISLPPQPTWTRQSGSMT